MGEAPQGNPKRFIVELIKPRLRCVQSLPCCFGVSRALHKVLRSCVVLRTHALRIFTLSGRRDESALSACGMRSILPQVHDLYGGIRHVAPLEHRRVVFTHCGFRGAVDSSVSKTTVGNPYVEPRTLSRAMRDVGPITPEIVQGRPGIPRGVFRGTTERRLGGIGSWKKVSWTSCDAIHGTGRKHHRRMRLLAAIACTTVVHGKGIGVPLTDRILHKLPHELQTIVRRTFTRDGDESLTGAPTVCPFVRVGHLPERGKIVLRPSWHVAVFTMDKIITVLALCRRGRTIKRGSVCACLQRTFGGVGCGTAIIACNGGGVCVCTQAPRTRDLFQCQTRDGHRGLHMLQRLFRTFLARETCKRALRGF